MNDNPEEIKREEKIRKLTGEPLYPLLVRMAIPSMLQFLLCGMFLQNIGRFGEATFGCK